MIWFLTMLKYFEKENKKYMIKLGKDPQVYLLAYPERTVDSSTGLAIFGEPETYAIKAVFVPYAASRLGRVFGEDLRREVRGEHFEGENLLFVDEKWLRDNGIVIDTQFDRIIWDGDQYKILSKGGFPHYHRVSLYVCRRISETMKD